MHVYLGAGTTSVTAGGAMRASVVPVRAVKVTVSHAGMVLNKESA